MEESVWSMWNKNSIFLICIAAMVNTSVLKADATKESSAFVLRSITTENGSSDKNLSRSSWTWVDNCHVLKPHDLTDFGTHYSLFTAYQQQTILNNEKTKGKTCADFSYIGTIEQDLWSGGSLIIYGEGGKGRGIDPLLNSFLSTNAAIEEADIYLSRLFFLNDFSNGRLQTVAGKIELSDFFDTSAVANCETREFLASPLVNNPTIPFPDDGLGAAFKLNTERFYFQAGFADARAKGTTTGIHSAFCEDFKLFQILELGLLQDLNNREGTYRFVYWHDSVSENNDGLGLSFDQQINNKFTVFTRYGYAKHPVSDMKHFWSAGGRVNGLWSKTKKDFLEIAVARGINSRRSNRRSESLVEMNYSAQINKSLTITPIIQFIAGLPGNEGADNAVIAGLRLVWAF